MDNLAGGGGRVARVLPILMFGGGDGIIRYINVRREVDGVGAWSADTWLIHGTCALKEEGKGKGGVTPSIG